MRDRLRKVIMGENAVWRHAELCSNCSHSIAPGQGVQKVKERAAMSNVREEIKEQKKNSVREEGRNDGGEILPIVGSEYHAYLQLQTSI